MEASFCGCDDGKFSGLHFTIQHLKQIGRDLCRALIPYCDLSLPPSPKPINNHKSQGHIPSVGVLQQKEEVKDKVEPKHEEKYFNLV
jgi:hypothetical protein